MTRIVLISGANRGVGFGILAGLAKALSSDTYLLGCRSVSSGDEAIAKLRKEGLTAAMEVVQMDVTDDTSLHAAATLIKKKYGRLDSKFPS
jgi:NAD(P)-dependent dehydrogenase (short-subunit alcohol dehydrogenase family)